MHGLPVRRDALLAALALALAAAAPGPARGGFIPIDPRGAYLRVNGESPSDAVPIDLLALGINPGDTITITRVGDFQRGTTPPFDEDVFLDVTAVFSSSSALGPPGALNRVVDAIPAGLDFVTVPTFIGGLPTDIPEDFEVSNFDGTVTSVTLQVPAGARFLFVATADSFFSDNSDPDGDFGVQITIQGAAAVPEPSSLALAGVSLLITLGYAARRWQARGLRAPGGR